MACYDALKLSHCLLMRRGGLTFAVSLARLRFGDQPGLISLFGTRFQILYRVYFIHGGDSTFQVAAFYIIPTKKEEMMQQA